jgi:hypothetical protein
VNGVHATVLAYGFYEAPSISVSIPAMAISYATYVRYYLHTVFMFDDSHTIDPSDRSYHHKSQFVYLVYPYFHMYIFVHARSYQVHFLHQAVLNLYL